jgi:hydrogenase nickel incorporation protein HypB
MSTSCSCGGESEHVLVSAREDAPELQRGLPRPRGQGWVRAVRTVRLERELLAEHNRIALRTRRVLAEIGVTMINLVGASGAGKTALLEASAERLRSAGIPLAVLEGDPTTDLDAKRLEAVGCRVLQIRTGAGCHLDASMVAEGLSTVAPAPGSVVLVENVGNLVCPSLFDIGELAKVVVMSVTEGEDKPLKYAHVFRTADLLVLTKTDLLPHVRFDEERCLANARRANTRLQVLRASSVLPGDGVDEWCDWVRRRRRE